MRIKVSELRYAHVLPSATLSALSSKVLTGIRFLPSFYEKARTWWEAENHIEAVFDEDGPNDNAHIAQTCGACGACCKDIPTHQIGIYMSAAEAMVAENLFPDKKIFRGEISSDGKWFGVVDVTAKGDCVMLGPKGCTLGDKRPLWCKIYHCEKYQGRPYQFEEKK